jgi:hypothetical protein
MRLRPLHVLCLSAALLGLALSIYKVHFPPGPIGDEAAYVMMTQSLWHDHNLTYEERDLARAYRTWDLGPIGLILATTDSGKTMHYAKPFVYSLAAVPFYAVFGVQGLVVFNMALFLAMFWAAWWFWRRESGHYGLFLAGFFFASTALVYVFWLQPEVFNMACVFFPLLIWLVLRNRPRWGWRDHALLGLAGVLLAAAYVSKEPTVLLGAPIVADLVWQRRFSGLLALAAPLAVGLALLFAVQWHMTGSFSPYRGVQRRSFESEFPLESRNDLWQLYRGTTFGSWSALGIETTPRLLVRNVAYFLVGRHTGLLAYFPFALFAVALFVAGPRGRPQWLLLAAIAGYCLVLFAMRPNNYHGGSGFVGNRYFASIYPALALLPGRIAARRSLLAPFAAAGLWTMAVVAVPLLQVAPEATLQAHVRGATFQALPLELSLLHKIPGYFLHGWGDGVWVVPKENFYADERHPNGVWVRGASRSQVVVVTAAPISSVRLRAFSLSARNELTMESAVDRVTVRFDSEEKRQGTPVELAVRPVARDLGFFPERKQPEYFYRFTLSTTDGLVPARRDPRSQDLRYLGVFLSFTGGAP